MMQSVFESPAPMVSEDQAAAIALNVFGVDGDARMLTSERDANFRLTTSSACFLLKIVNDREDLETSRFQLDLLQHLSTCDPLLPVPRLCADRHGGLETRVTLASGRSHAARMMTFLPGLSAHETERGRQQRDDLATLLARLDLCLSGFRQLPPGPPLLWDISRTDAVARLLETIEDGGDRMRALAILHYWQASIAPHLGRLRHQVIHNDLNRCNYLVDDHDRISGVIDFGDAVMAPLVVDLATAAAYQLDGVDDPVEALVEMATAYCRIVPLSAGELELLWGLVAARWAITVGITRWRAREHPQNARYILRNEALSVRGMRQFHDSDPAGVADRLRSVCGERAA